MPPVKPTKNKKEKSGPPSASKSSTEKPNKDWSAFPVIGLGASAGGLNALKAFFLNIADNSAMAYIVVVHLSPEQPSMLAQILDTVSPIPVRTAENNQQIRPDHAYIIPPGNEISLFKGAIQLTAPVKKAVSYPIDIFFKSLALDQKEHSAAIILSGTGTDGTIGIKEIKINNGLVIAQSEASADFDGMPESAVHSGLVDIICAPEQMPGKLIDFFSHPVNGAHWHTKVQKNQQEWLNQIFSILRARVGHDFSLYKMNTILRRIHRRMVLNHIENQDTYIRFLKENPGEVDALFRDMLIGVTNFFRDPESFTALSDRILPEVISNLGENDVFRAWIPGCSTGEEVYSLAIILRESLDKISPKIHLQMFGTDIDDTAIAKAREAVYPASISSEIDNTLLNRYFTKEGDFFRVKKRIRDCAIFSVQNILQDPPFSRLHLLCCRNLLIYLDTAAQKKLLPLFHYTLTKKGILMLGSSETIGGFSKLFKPLDKKWKIFRKKDVPIALKQAVNFPSGMPRHESNPIELKSLPMKNRSNINQLMQDSILHHFAPTAVLTDANGDILNIQGRTGKYLEPPSGNPTHNVVDLARQGLRIELSSALRKAGTTLKPVIRKHLSVKTNGDFQMIDLHVIPQDSPKELAGNFLIAFKETEDEPVNIDTEKQPQKGMSTDAARIAMLEKELKISRENHQTTIEELESSNEELQSSNEELQSTNEELESSKEELQSLNEEMQTVNSELENKVLELTSSHDDMHNLMNSIEIATIFVDNHLNIKRFTSEATRIINLIPADIGRPIEHFVTNLFYDDILSDLSEVLDTLNTREIEVQATDGQWYNMRVLPYRTTENKIDGAILSFLSISDQKNAQKMLKENTKELVRSIFDMNADPLVVLDNSGKMVIANQVFTKLFAVDQNAISGRDIRLLSEKGINSEDLNSKLEVALKNDKNFVSEKFELDGPQHRQKFIIEGRSIQRDTGLPYRVLLRFIRQ